MKNFEINLPAIPSDDALQVAARVWCDDEVATREMDSVLATAFAKRLDALMLSNRLLTERLEQAVEGLQLIDHLKEGHEEDYIERAQKISFETLAGLRHE
jgi:hypothetical protein